MAKNQGVANLAPTPPGRGRGLRGAARGRVQGLPRPELGRGGLASGRGGFLWGNAFTISICVPRCEFPTASPNMQTLPTGFQDRFKE